MIANFPNRLVASLMRLVVFPFGSPHALPSDRLGQHVARLLIEPSATRDRLTAGMFIGDPDEPTGLLDRARVAAVAAEPIERKLRSAVRSGKLASRRIAAGSRPAIGAVSMQRAGCISWAAATT